MRRPWLAVLAVVALACNARQAGHDRRWLRKLTPAPLGVEHPHRGEPRVAKVRVWVDEDFRAQRVHWREEVSEQLDDANQFLEPALGLRLEAIAIEPWAIRTAGRELGNALEELERVDPGVDVPWVLGLVSSVPMVAASYEQIGMTRILGRHLVLRGYAEQAERKEWAEYLPTLTVGEREALYETRRRHKITTLLVHELGHTLGAPHEADASWIMNPGYTLAVATLSDQSRKLMELALEGRLASPPDPPEVTAGKLLSFLDQNPWGGWSDEDLELVRTELAARAKAPSTDPRAPVEDLPVPAAALAQLQRAQALTARRQFDEALAELDALIAAYPSAGELRLAVCQIRLVKDGPDAAPAIAACDRALEVNPGDARPFLARVDALFAAGMDDKALALLPAAEKVAGDTAALWEQIAVVYQRRGMVSAAERAVAHVPAPDHPVRVWAARTRARYGLPAEGKARIAEADEPAHVQAVRELLDLVYASKFADAEARARAATKRWPRSPGVLGARCDLALRQGQAAAAGKLCDQAIAAWPGAAWAQYLRGVMALQRGKTRPAIVALRAAIAAEPELAQAYRTLGKALTMAGDQAGHDALDAAYQQRFGGRLPE